MTPIKLPVVYDQFDPRWAKVLLGFNTDPKYNFYNYGCLVTDLCAILAYYRVQLTPDQLNEKLKSLPDGSGFQKLGLYVSGAVQQLFPLIQEKRTLTPDALTDEQLAEIRSALDSGYPVLLGIDYNPKTLLVDYHFVVAVAYNSNDENDITIVDPLGGRIHSLKDYLAGVKPSARVTIEQYSIFTGQLAADLNPADKDTAAQPAAPANSGSVLPSNYPQIIHNSTEWETLAKKFSPGDAPENVSAAALEDHIRKQLPVQTVEKEVIKEVPVPAQPSDGSADAKWEQTVEYLELGKIGSEASFDDAKRVIAGIRSRQTDLDNQAKQANINSAKKDTEILNLNEEIGKLKADLLQTEKLHKVEIDSLKESSPSFDKLVKQYKAIIGDKDAALRAKIDEVKQLRIDLTAQNIVDAAAAVTAASKQSIWNKELKFKPVDAVLSFIKRFLIIKW